MNARTLPIVLTFLITVLLSVNTAYAANCKGVKFNFENNRSTKIRIDQVIVDSAGKQWSHDINNKVVFSGETYTTDKLRLNTLRVGRAGKFSVKYRWFDAKTKKWSKNTTSKGPELQCDDNMTIRFDLH